MSRNLKHFSLGECTRHSAMPYRCDWDCPKSSSSAQCSVLPCLVCLPLAWNR